MKRIINLVSILIITVTATLVSQPQLDKAKDLMKENKAAEAVAVCQTYIKSSPSDENAWLILAKACQQANMLDSAENAAKKVIGLDDELLEGYAVLGQVQILKKNFKEAGATAKAGLSMIKKKQPKYPALLVVQAQSFLAADSADKALVAAAEAKELDPGLAIAYEIMGDAYLMQKVAPMAISSYEKSLGIDPMQPRTMNKLATAFASDKQWSEAEKVYIRLLEQYPDEETGRLSLAGLYYRAKWWRKCAATLKEYFIKAKNPSNDVQSIYMESLYNSAQYKEAFQIAQKFLKTDPNSPLATRVAAYGHADVKQYAQSLELYKKLETIDTLRFDDYRKRSFVYKQIKMDTLAALDLESAVVDTLQSDLVRSNMYGELGSLWMKLKTWDRAAESFEKRIQIDSSAIGAYINYASCMIQLDQYDKASSALKKAIANNPKYPPAYINLGFCYFQMKDYDAGRKEFEKAIEVVDTAEYKYRFELADANRMIALAIMLEKKSTSEASQKKWEEAIVYLKRSIKYKEDVAQSHLLLGQCYQNLNKKEDAIREYKRTLKLDPKNDQAKKGLEMLPPE